MKRSNIIEARRAKVSPKTRERVNQSFLILDWLHDFLDDNGLKQKDLADRIGKAQKKITRRPDE